MKRATVILPFNKGGEWTDPLLGGGFKAKFDENAQTQVPVRANYTKEQFDSPNTSIAHFNRDITLIYNQFTPTFTFTPNAINNPLLQTTLTLTKFEFLANALTPSAPYTRELYSITTYDQRTSAPLSKDTATMSRQFTAKISAPATPHTRLTDSSQQQARSQLL